MSVLEIEQRLSDYNQKYQTVLRAILDQPHSEALLRARDQLKELCALTEVDLEKAKQAAKAVAAAAPPVVVPDFISKGARVRAKYAKDDKLHDAIVHGIDGSSVMIEYVGYKQFATLPFDHVKPPLAADKSNKRALPKVQLDTEGNIVIPDHLRLKPTDTDEEREQKRKKVKTLKSAGRLQKNDFVHENKKSSWQQFQQKKAKEAKGTPKESIFRTSETGRVGVTGSGKPVTEFVDRSLFRQLAPARGSMPDEAQEAPQ
eukprot:TRINITY_DN833_c0_g1_i2.p1 TRINITY_DN833_c0_g1~~TRINITY_DN833_c0_g1_i2.p1  ORF type:complete len:272 (-),score=51.12 TRINITY_DN833_c0_g1_i2:882-1658(-)